MDFKKLKPNLENGIYDPGKPGFWSKLNKKLRITLTVIILAAIGYVAVAIVFMFFFFPHTNINNVDCGMKTVRQAEKLFNEKANAYSITIKGRQDYEDELTGEEVGLTISVEDTLKDCLRKQPDFQWPKAFFTSRDIDGEAGISLDEDKYEACLDKMECLDTDQMVPPEDAHLSEYSEDSGYTIVGEVKGTTIDREDFAQKLEIAIVNLDSTFSISKAGCYENPAVKSDDETLNSLKDQANKLVHPTITLTFGDQKEVIDGSVISEWLDIGEESVSLNDKKVDDYVEGLADQYDTKWKSKELTAHDGTTVTVAGGNYGWQLNVDQTVTLIKDAIRSDEDYTGDPVYYQTAADSDAKKDYGDTYIEVSLSEQHMWYYEKGVQVFESDLVSGSVQDDTETPQGAYRIAYKSTDYTLKGDDNSSTKVSYWIPFVNNCGFHDDAERTVFGGVIYQTDGSEGGIELPADKAKELYSLIDKGTAVLIYDGTVD